MRKYLIIAFLSIFQHCVGQISLPVLKIRQLGQELDTIKVDEYFIVEIGDTIKYSKSEIFVNKLAIYHSRHPNYILAGFYNSESEYFGKVDSLIMRCCEGVDETKLIRNEIFFYSFNDGVDTLVINGSLYMEINPYQDIYGFFDSKVTDPFGNIVIKGEPHYSFYRNGSISSAPMYNNEFGTVKHYWDEKGRKKCEGAFRMNQKNGKWTYYNKRGKIIRSEYYEMGILKNTI